MRDALTDWLAQYRAMTTGEWVCWAAMMAVLLTTLTGVLLNA